MWNLRFGKAEAKRVILCSLVLLLAVLSGVVLFVRGKAGKETVYEVPFSFGGLFSGQLRAANWEMLVPDSWKMRFTIGSDGNEPGLNRVSIVPSIRLKVRDKVVGQTLYGDISCSRVEISRVEKNVFIVRAYLEIKFRRNLLQRAYLICFFRKSCVTINQYNHLLMFILRSDEKGWSIQQ